MSWVALGGCLAVTLAVSLLALAHERSRDGLRFNTRAEALQGAVVERVASYVQVLKGAAGLFAASEAVGRDEWRAYYERLELSEHYRGVQALAFVAYVARTNVADFLAGTRQDRTRDYDPAGFRIWPEADREGHDVVTYIEPMRSNLAALGYDLASEPARRQAAEEARDTGEARLTGKIRLVQASAGPGVLLLLPIYFNGTNPTNVVQRRARLQGWVDASFVMKDLMAGINQYTGGEVAVEIYDGTETTPETLLYRDGDDPTLAASSPRSQAAFRLKTTVPVEHRTWTMRFAAQPAFRAPYGHALPRLLGAAGVCISLLVFGMVR